MSAVGSCVSQRLSPHSAGRTRRALLHIDEVDPGFGRKAWAELVTQHARRHGFHRPLGEVAELKGAEGDSDEARDGEAKRFEHALDLAVLPLAQSHGEPGIAALDAIQRRLDTRIVDAVDRDAALQRIEPCLVDFAVGADSIAAQPPGRR